MNSSSNHKQRRRIAIAVQSAMLLTLSFLHGEVLAQPKPANTPKSALCTRDNALELIKQQVSLTRTFDNSVRRITVLIKAADLLWPHEQSRARAVFTEAFELAIVTENENENEKRGSRVLLLRLQVPDQRFVVIRAVARRDSAWAKNLTQKMLKVAEDSSGASTRGSFENTLTAVRLLDSAIKLTGTDIKAALDLATASFNYPASSWLTHFLYELAKVNQQAADQFYSQALMVYRDRPMREFLYLQAYPFAWHETLNTPIFAFYSVPSNFVTNQNLQRQFVQALLRRAQQALELPPDESDSYRHSNGTLMPGPLHLLLTLMLLEPQVKESLPDLWGSLTQAKDRMLVSLPVDTQSKLAQPDRTTTRNSEPAFEEKIEAALKVPDVDERNGLIANAVVGVATAIDTSVPAVIDAIDKITDSNLRRALLEWFHFQRATVAINQKQFEDAEKLTARVDGLEQRAFLHTQIAKALLNNTDTQTHGRELLDQAISEAKKVGVGIFVARTLLTASNLYMKIDMGQSISLMTDAVNCINRIENPDFVRDDQSLVNAPERKGRGGEYAGEYDLRFYMPGPDPLSAFREMAKVDFDTTLSQSSALTDKFQRAMSTLGLVEICLQAAPPPRKVQPKRPTGLS
jgi:hypothetical protein